MADSSKHTFSSVTLNSYPLRVRAEGGGRQRVWGGRERVRVRARMRVKRGRESVGGRGN